MKLKNVRNRLVFFPRGSLLAIAALLLPVLIITAVFFYQVNQSLKENSRVLSAVMAEHVVTQVDALVQELINVSDVFFNAPEMMGIFEAPFSAGNVNELYHAYWTMTDLFLTANPLSSDARIDAIYTRGGILFNFRLNPGRVDSPESAYYLAVSRAAKKKIQELRVDAVENSTGMRWYFLDYDIFAGGEAEPLEESAEADTESGAREKRFLLGSRRVYNRRNGQYLATHLFLLREADINARYRTHYSSGKETVVVFDQDLNLISTSDELLLKDASLCGSFASEMREETASVDGDLSRLRLISVEGQPLLVSAVRSEYTGWLTVVVTPLDAVSLYKTPLFRVMLLSLALILALGIGGSVLFVRQINIRERRSRELEMQVLAGQINPHFVYNTLETIVWKAQQAGSPEIGKIASQLGTLLRLSISGHELLITVQQELQHVTLYYTLQKQRYKERLELSVDECAPEILTLRTLRLILQPCVENAIIRGMRPRGQPLHIHLSLAQRGGGLYFRIRDDGNGISAERLAAIRRSLSRAGEDDYEAPLAEGSTAADHETGPRRRGIGLRNIHDRIILCYGRDYGLTIESAPEEGTLVTIKVPVVTE